MADELLSSAALFNHSIALPGFEGPEKPTITTDIKYHNGCFIVVSPDNKPISCMLSMLNKYTESFTITA